MSDRKQNNKKNFASLTIFNKTYKFPIYNSIEGEPVIDIS